MPQYTQKKRRNTCIAFSLHYDLYGHALAQEPLTRGHDIFSILVDPSLIMIYLHSINMIYTWV